MRSKRLYYINEVSKIIFEKASCRLGIDEIAMSVGVTKKTLYNYFESKQQLVECVVDSFIKKYVDNIQSKMFEAENSLCALVATSRTISDFMNHSAVQKGTIEIAEMQRILVERRNDVLEMVIFAFKKGVREGLIDCDINEVLAGKLFLSEIVLFLGKDVLASSLFVNSEHDQIIYYILKGYCTPHGLKVLREYLDIRVLVS